MKRLTIIIVAMLVATLCNGQIFGPKMLTDLKIYPDQKTVSRSGFERTFRNRKIISEEEISIPGIKKVFPEAKFIEIYYRDYGMFGEYFGHMYYMKYKNMYYDVRKHLPILEFKTNNDEFCDIDLKEKIGIYATISCYEKVKSVIVVDSIHNIYINNSELDPREYETFYRINNKTYKGLSLVENGEIGYFTISYNDIGYGCTYSPIQDKRSKSIRLNFINTEEESEDFLFYHYYDVSNTNNAIIRITGLDANTPVIISFYRGYDPKDFITSFSTYSDNTGAAEYNYSSALQTGVYFIKVTSQGHTTPFFYDFFIPEDRIEGALTPGVSVFRIYTTEMFFNSIAGGLSLTYIEYKALVKNVIEKSYNVYNNLGLIPNNGIKDLNNVIEIYLHNSLQSFFPYHKILTSAGNPISFDVLSNNDQYIQVDYSFGNMISSYYSLNCSLSHLIKTLVSHEFFHVVQKSINPNISSNENMGWLVDGTARFMQTVFLEQEPDYSGDAITEFQKGLYGFDSRNYLTTRLYPVPGNDNLGQLEKIEYDYCLYWRYLYEKYKPNASPMEKCEIIKKAIQNCPSSYNLSAIKTQMDAAFTNTQGGAFNNFQHSLTHFAKDVALIKYSIGQWMYSNTYVIPGVHEVAYTGEYCSKDANTNAAYGISIKKIQLCGYGSYTVSFNKNTFWGNCSYGIYVYATNATHSQIYLPSTPSDPVVQFDGSNSISCTFDNLPAGSVLYLAFVQTRLADANSSVNYVIINNSSFNNLIANFSPTNVSITPGTYVVFQDASSGSPNVYDWNFPGGNPANSTSQITSVRYDNEGVFPVTLKIKKGNHESSKTITQCVNVTYSAADAPVADFSYYVANSTVTFNDISTNSPASWFWDFGDGFTSTQQNPFHTYANNTNVSYTVTMTCSNASGYSSAVKTIEFSSQGTITITGRVLLDNIATAGVLVKTLPNGPITYTGANGNYTLILNNNFSGTIIPEQSGYTCAPAIFTDLQHSISGLNFGMFQAQISVSSEQIYGTYFCFTVNNAPIGTERYQWTITKDNSGISEYEETLSRKLNHFFNMSSSNDEYTVEVNAIDNMGQAFYASVSITIFHTSIIDSYAYPANNCSAVRKGECYYLYDGSSPFSEVSRVVIWSSNGTTQIWDTDNPNSLQDSKAPEHSMYRANCRKFEQCFSAQGVYSGSLTAYDLAGYPQGSYDYGITVVDCDLTSTNFNNSVGFTYNNIKHTYSGKQHISSMTNLPGFQNYNTSIKACKEIILEGDMEIEPGPGFEFNLEIDPCLYEEEMTNAVEQEEYAQAIPNEPAEEQKLMLTGDYGVKIYPNPNEGKFAVETLNNDIQSIQIYNSVGQLMQSFDNLGNTLYLMDISNQPKGVYYLKVRSIKSVQTFKVINTVIL